MDEYQIVIPDHIEETHEDPIAWWVDECLGTFAGWDSGLPEDLSLDAMALVILGIAAIENENRKNGIVPGKISQVDWMNRLAVLKTNVLGDI